MLQLFPPRVVLPISECSSEVVLQGLVPGANATVWVSGAVVAHGPITAPVQSFTLSRKLVAGEEVRCKQDFATEGSDFSPESVKVLRGPVSPSELNPLNTVSHLYECGLASGSMALFLARQWSCGRAELYGGLHNLPDGNARFVLSSKISSGEVFQVEQTACGVTSTPTQLPVPDPLPLIGQLKISPPTIVGPLVDCLSQIGVKDVLEGANVVIHRGSGDEFALFDRSESRLNLVDPLHFPESLTASQEFPQCEVVSDESQPPIPVEQFLPVPALLGPICHRDRTVRIVGLLPNATVMLLSDGHDFAYGTAWDTVCDFHVPDLTGIHQLSVKQGLCAPIKWSSPSNEEPVTPTPVFGDLFLELGKAFECGRLIHVTGCAPGVIVYVQSKFWGGPIGWAYCEADQVDIPLAVPLKKGDFIKATSKLCGDHYESDEVEVEPLPPVKVPHVAEPVHDCGGSVRVLDVVPGATVEVYVNGTFAGSTRAVFPEVNVPLKQPLKEGDQVSARQMICAMITGRGEPVRYHEDHDVTLKPFQSGHLSERLCQLTGGSDPEPGHAHLNDTTIWKLYGTDLGINFEHAGRLYIFFGDEGIDDSESQTRDDDPIFYTTDWKVEPAGFRMNVVAAPKSDRFLPLTINGQSPLKNFEVPTGGFSHNGKFYLFISRRGAPDNAAMKLSYLVSASNPLSGFDVVYPVDEQPGWHGGPATGRDEPQPVEVH